MEVSAKVGTGKDRKHPGASATVNYSFGKDLDEAVKKFGAETVFKGFVADAKVGLQGVIRTALEAGKSAADVQKVAAAHKPGMRKKGKSKAEKLREQFQALSPEEQKEALEVLR